MAPHTDLNKLGRGEKGAGQGSFQVTLKGLWSNVHWHLWRWIQSLAKKQQMSLFSRGTMSCLPWSQDVASHTIPIIETIWPSSLTQSWLSLQDPAWPEAVLDSTALSLHPHTALIPVLERVPVYDTGSYWISTSVPADESLSKYLLGTPSQGPA